jgi:hypothetical protein
MIVIATAQTMLFFVRVGEQLFLPVFHNLLQKRVLVIGLNIEGFSGFKMMEYLTVFSPTPESITASASLKSLSISRSTCFIPGRVFFLFFE